MPGLDPGIHLSSQNISSRWIAGHRRAEATPFFERLSPAMTGCDRQNQRSPTRMVSPGLMEVPSGTMARLVAEASLWVRVTLSRLARGEKPPAIATALSTLILGT